MTALTLTVAECGKMEWSLVSVSACVLYCPFQSQFFEAEVEHDGLFDIIGVRHHTSLTCASNMMNVPEQVVGASNLSGTSER